eukprot:COSAG02_NODE_7902_length_2798_cov_2.561319_6_plen_108_part_00
MHDTHAMHAHACGASGRPVVAPRVVVGARSVGGRGPRRRERSMALLAEVVTAEEAAAGEIDEEKLSAMAAAFGQSSLGRQLAYGPAPARENFTQLKSGIAVQLSSLW